MSELISVIVTSYNHAAYLRQRLDSLIAQTYPHKEIIVIDDFSTDASRQILKSYQNVPGLKVFLLEENQGYVYACNYGVSLAQGPYVMFAESDDFNDPRHLEALYQNIKSSDQVGAAFSRSLLVDESGIVSGDDFGGQFRGFRKFCAKSVQIPRKKMQDFLLRACVIPNMSAVLFRKRDFVLIGGLSDSFKVCSDWDFWCRMARVCDFYYVAEPLNYFRRHRTTVRQIFGLEPQLVEVSRLLVAASLRMNLGALRRLCFNFNLGFMLAHEALFSHQKKMRGICNIFRYDLKINNVFIFFGLVRSFVDLLISKLKITFSREKKITGFS